jgi:hypothetical protein
LPHQPSPIMPIRIILEFPTRLREFRGMLPYGRQFC